MLTFIIFSFNRAMQLDTLLRSIVAYAQTPCRIVVLYNCTTSCQNGYELLKKQYPQVGFRKERKLEKGDKSGSFPWTLANLKRFVRYEYLRHVKSDFRALLIDILRETEDEYIAFLTDDSVFIRPFELPKDVAERISAAPRDVSFSLRLGTNISSQLNSWREFNADIITWDYDDPWNEKSYDKTKQEVFALADFVRSRDEPVVLIGDLKASAWSWLLNDLESYAGLKPQERLPVSGKDLPFYA
ncbi:MAG: hypothetical protein J6X34_08495, partial [Clostridia bacterium]|nr:hypothetical protein [Clostridia bacterium]